MDPVTLYIFALIVLPMIALAIWAIRKKRRDKNARSSNSSSKRQTPTQDTTNQLINKINEQNTYSNKIGIIQAYIRASYKYIPAKEIYDNACIINSYDRPTPYCVIHLHYGLIELINLIYKLRDSDTTAIDYCLLMCDMDIALYDEVRKVSIKELHDDFVYAGSLSRKIIILEKRGEYAEALEACDFAINNGYKNGAKDDGSNSFIKQRNRIKNKLDKIPTKDIISKP